MKADFSAEKCLTFKTVVIYLKLIVIFVQSRHFNKDMQFGK